MTNEYAGLETLRVYLSLGSMDTADDTELKKFLRTSSRAIDKFCNRIFYPERKIRRYDIPEDSLTVLKVEHDLLESKGLSSVNGASEISSGVYWLRCGDDWNRTPYDRVEIDESSGSLFNYSG